METGNLARRILVLATLFSLVLPSRIFADETVSDVSSSSGDTASLQIQIDEQQGIYDALTRQLQPLEDALAQKRQQAASLENQLSILDDQIATTNIDVERRSSLLKKLQLEIEELAGEMKEKKSEIRQQKDRISEILRSLNRFSQKSTLEAWLSNETLSGFYHQMKNLQSVESQAKTSLDVLVQLQNDMETKQGTQLKKQQQTQQELQRLQDLQANLALQQNAKEQLLSETRGDEAKFEALVDKSTEDQIRADTTIQQLKKQYCATQGDATCLDTDPKTLIWPVHGPITAGFFDSSYPFAAQIGPHPAIDIGVPSGTPIRAVADGTVVHVGLSDNSYPMSYCPPGSPLGGFVVPAYEWITIQHSSSFFSLYGHVSFITIADGQRVMQGDVIGYTGGVPREKGAGCWTRGNGHLHFSIFTPFPVDPLQYLP